MRDSTFISIHGSEILRRAGAKDRESVRNLLQSLWSLGDGEDVAAAFDIAQAYGREAFELGEEAEEVVRTVLALGRALADAERKQAAGAEGAKRGPLVEEAAARAAGAFVVEGRARREAWLSFLCHDLKNPLNTILNALWLIREHVATGNVERFLDLAERSVRRMEAGIKEVRDLQAKEHTTPSFTGDRSAPASAPPASKPPAG